MSAPRGHQKTQSRKLTKRAARRPEHVDKYAPQNDNTDDREMNRKLDELLARFNGEEADRG